MLFRKISFPAAETLSICKRSRILVSFAAVFWDGALRDIPKNGCESRRRLKLTETAKRTNQLTQAKPAQEHTCSNEWRFLIGRKSGASFISNLCGSNEKALFHFHFRWSKNFKIQTESREVVRIPLRGSLKYYSSSIEEGFRTSLVNFTFLLERGRVDNSWIGMVVIPGCQVRNSFVVRFV